MNFLTKNKVFLLGLLGAIAISLQQFIGVEAIDWLAVAYAGFLAVGSYLANNLRGQVQTITGIIVGAIATMWQSYQSGGQVDFGAILLLVAVNLALAFSSPAKTTGYEESRVITSAKAEAETIDARR